MEVLKRRRYETRFAPVELRIGMHDQSLDGSVQLGKNPLVGSYPEPNTEALAVFTLSGNGATGRYLTLQRIGYDHLEVAELYVS